MIPSKYKKIKKKLKDAKMLKRKIMGEHGGSDSDKKKVCASKKL